MAAGDFTQMRFAYSPVSEAIDSLNMLHTGRVHPLHRGWADIARERLRGLDTALLHAIVPARRVVLTPPLDINGRTTIEHQLQLVADWPPDLLRAELDSLWQGFPMPAAAREVIADGPAGAGGSRPPCELTGTLRLRRTGISCRPSSTLTLPTGLGGSPSAGSPRCWRTCILSCSSTSPRSGSTRPATMNATWPDRACCSSRACSPGRTSCSTRGASGRRPSFMAPVASPRCGRRAGPAGACEDALSALIGRGRAAILRA